ncbi:MAG: hypothetical protein R3B93_24515 [Bacteroidia bacterium]
MNKYSGIIQKKTLAKWIFWPALVFLGFPFGCRERLTPDFESLGTPTTERLEAVHFVNASTGFIAGGTRFESSRIFRTDNQGQSWVEQEAIIEYEKIIFDLYFRDEMLGFATGYEGKILKTTDQGNTWKLFQSRFWLPLHGIAMADESVVVAVGGNGYDRGIIHRSEDQGETWTMIDTFDFELRDVVFTSPQIGFAAGYSAILKTEDGGITWDFTTAQKEFFSALSFPSPNTGYAVGRTGPSPKPPMVGIPGNASAMGIIHYCPDMLIAKFPSSMKKLVTSSEIEVSSSKPPTEAKAGFELKKKPKPTSTISLCLKKEMEFSLGMKGLFSILRNKIFQRKPMKIYRRYS